MQLGESQGRILDLLKRRGSGTIPALAEALDLNVETVRSHLRALTAAGLVRREGSLVRGRGRPEIVYGLSESAEAYFPNHEAEILRELASFLQERGHAGLLRRFFEGRVAARRESALRRVEGLEGVDRLREAARILAEEGFMPEIGQDDAGRTVLALTHCPLRGVVDVTRAPCRAELTFVRELIGRDMERVAYIPAGGASCCYALEEAG